VHGDAAGRGTEGRNRDREHRREFPSRHERAQVEYVDRVAAGIDREDAAAAAIAVHRVSSIAGLAGDGGS